MSRLGAGILLQAFVGYVVEECRQILLEVIQKWDRCLTNLEMAILRDV